MSGINFSRKEWIDLVFEDRNKSYGAYQLRVESGETMLKALFLGVLLLMSLVSIPVIANHYNKNEEKIVPESIERVLPPVTYIKDLPKPEPKVPEKQATKVSAVDVQKDVIPTITEHTTTPTQMLSRDGVKGLVTGTDYREGQQDSSSIASNPGVETAAGAKSCSPQVIEECIH